MLQHHIPLVRSVVVANTPLDAAKRVIGTWIGASVAVNSALAEKSDPKKLSVYKPLNTMSDDAM